MTGKPSEPIDADNLELFAINSGELYKDHRTLANKPTWEWSKHLRTKVIPLYERQVSRGPVEVSDLTVILVSASLKLYYVTHNAEAAARCHKAAADFTRRVAALVRAREDETCTRQPIDDARTLDSIILDARAAVVGLP